MGWRPLRSRHSPAAAAQYDALHEGLPDWIGPAIAAWVWQQATASVQEYDNTQHPDLIGRVQRQLRLSGLDWRRDDESAAKSLLNLMAENDEQGLEILDAILHLTPNHQFRPAGALAVLLDEGGSVWRVVSTDDGDTHLERRVPKEVDEAARFVMSTDDRASQHLRSAWELAYGRSPNASQSYRESVRAVETIGAPVISPKNDRATLGTMIRDMRDGAKNFETVFTDTTTDGVEVVLRDMQLLWHAQFDRHGTHDESIPISVSVEEARAAVHLALMLTQWFRAGVIRRQP